MVRVDGAYERARRAFQGPTLALLHQRRAPLVVALLGELFTPERSTVPVDDAHTEVADALAQLRAAGHENLPEDSARDLCRQWVGAGWLVYQVGEPGEEYRLTAHATDALDVASRAGGPRTRVTRSRVRTLLDAVEQLAAEADPDVEARRRRLTRDLERIQAELDALATDERVEPAGEEHLLESAENVVALVSDLPADFVRVAESIQTLQRDVVRQLRSDDRPTGEVLGAYLERAEHLLEATAEGRAFAGAVRVLGDSERLDALAAQLELLLAQPFAGRLEPRQRAELRSLVTQLERGLELVLGTQRRASHVIATQVRHHDPLRDRQVDDLLRRAFTALSEWFPTTRRGQDVEALRRLPRAAPGRLRTTLADLRPPAPPVPLRDWADDDGQARGEGAQGWGGPRYGELAAALEAALADAGASPGADGETRTVDVAAVFERLGDTDRRPVDLVGLLELADLHGAREASTVSTVTATRPDGTRRAFAFAETVVPVHNSSEPKPPGCASRDAAPSEGGGRADIDEGAA